MPYSLSPLRSLVAPLLLAGCLLPVAHAQDPARTVSDTVAFNSTGRVEIDNHKGSITVTTWDRAQVGYEVTLEPSEDDSVLVPASHVTHTNQVFSFGLSDWSFEIPGLLSISPGGTSPPIAHYRVTMPKTAELEIDDHASTIEVSDVRADVSIDTHEGEVTVDGVRGFLELETSSGTAEATGLHGGVDLETHGGHITVSFEEFTAASSAETHSGSLRFFLPAETGFELELDLDEEHLVVDEAFGSPSSDDDRRTYNGGGPELQIESLSGQVELRPRESFGTSSSP